MRSPVRTAWLIFAAPFGFVRCADDPPTSQPVFQIYTAEAFPPTASCGGGPLHWTFRLHLVNTTAVDVSIDSVGMRGVVRSATTTAPVGLSVYQRTSLAYTPVPALVRARDGDVLLLATLDGTCFAYPGVRNQDMANVDVTLLVYTSAGLFTTTPLNIVHTWTF